MNKSTSFLPELQKATGHFDYPMTNDYMFRALCQKNNKALTGLISALLRLPVEKIHSVVITNPIVLGDACDDKEFRLDVRIVLNEKNYRIYSDNFALNVLDLSKVKLATSQSHSLFETIVKQPRNNC